MGRKTPDGDRHSRQGSQLDDTADVSVAANIDTSDKPISRICKLPRWMATGLLAAATVGGGAVLGWFD